MPWGPIRLLWPVKHTTSMCWRSMSMGNSPAGLGRVQNEQQPVHHGRSAPPARCPARPRSDWSRGCTPPPWYWAAAAVQSPRSPIRPCRSAGTKSTSVPAPAGGTAAGARSCAPSRWRSHGPPAPEGRRCADVQRLVELGVKAHTVRPGPAEARRQRLPARRRCSGPPPGPPAWVPRPLLP